MCKETEKEPRNAAELQSSIDEIRKEAEKQGLAIVVSWTDEYGGIQSVQIGRGDRIQIGLKR